ncbi:hypothetical protein C7821_108314 [Streptomyces sp. VMFN-G11Ma]|nr:hypothetical protein C7821_108314 [Streptomyces sp. VMFN-G11Ma]
MRLGWIEGAGGGFLRRADGGVPGGGAVALCRAGGRCRAGGGFAPRGWGGAVRAGGGFAPRGWGGAVRAGGGFAPRGWGGAVRAGGGFAPTRREARCGRTAACAERTRGSVRADSSIAPTRETQRADGQQHCADPRETDCGRAAALPRADERQRAGGRAAALHRPDERQRAVGQRLCLEGTRGSGRAAALRRLGERRRTVGDFAPTQREATGGQRRRADAHRPGDSRRSGRSAWHRADGRSRCDGPHVPGAPPPGTSTDQWAISAPTARAHRAARDTSTPALDARTSTVIPATAVCLATAVVQPGSHEPGAPAHPGPAPYGTYTHGVVVVSGSKPSRSRMGRLWLEASTWR